MARAMSRAGGGWHAFSSATVLSPQPASLVWFLLPAFNQNCFLTMSHKYSDDVSWRFGLWGLEFHDTGLQCTYKARAPERCLVPARCFSTFHIVWGIWSLFSYIGGFKPAFWLYLVPLVLGFVLNLGTRLRASKPHVEVLLLVSVVILNMWSPWMCHQQAGEWFKWNTENRWTELEPHQLEVPLPLPLPMPLPMPLPLPKPLVLADYQSTPPPPICIVPPPPHVHPPPPRGGTVTWPMNNKKSIGNHRRQRRRRKILVGLY